MYINCHSYFSLRYGVLSEVQLLELAQQHQCSSMALTDINNTSACLNFIRLAPKYHVKPVVGIDFRTDVRQHYIGIAANNAGFQALNEFLSHHLHHKFPYPKYMPEFDNIYVIYPFEQATEWPHFVPADHEYIGVRPEQIRLLHLSRLKAYRHKMVVLQTLSFSTKRDYNIHRLLRAIDHNSLLSKLETSQQASVSETFVAPHALKHHFRLHADIIHQTQLLLDRCSIDFDFSAQRPTQNMTRYTGSRAEDQTLIRRLCRQQLSYRYQKVTDAIKARIRKELDLIEQMDFTAFFLINWNIVQYAKHKGYFHVGRGSGANSIVAYLLGITDVDPIQLDLYFERFMNLYRSSPPDFDIDFSWRDREDVTRYIFERFGKRGQAALVATYNTFKHSAAVRELGKVFGLPKHEIDRLSKGGYQYDQLDNLSQLVIRYAHYINGMPNYLSIHAGGVLISQRPIHYFSATFLPPKGFPTVQFDMVTAEDVGLFKFDILGQRGLAKIKDTLDIVRDNQPNQSAIDIHNVQQLYTDPQLNDSIRRGDCIGCFYVESPAMRMLLSKLGVDNYLGLVAASSIIRPGVAKSGMMREYILRHKYPEKRNEAHPVLRELLDDTYGVMVYQEDVIKVAHYFAGLDLSEADVLRRGMSGKYRSREEFLKVKQKFFDNCLMKGYPEDMVAEVWRQVESFAGYAFAKGHSASYAVESYQSLYLKTYFPLEYMVAVLNNGGGFYSRELYIHEARMKGARIHPPCINHSHYEVTIEGKDIYLGFGMIKDLQTDTATHILYQRKKNGPFQSFEDFFQRVSIGIEQMDMLIRVDALRSLGEDKRRLLWKARYHCRMQKNGSLEKFELFTTEITAVDLPVFHISELETAFDQIELLGFPLCNPFELLQHEPPDHVVAKEMPQFHKKIICMVGYLITVKRTRTYNGKTMFFGNFIDKEGQWIDTVHFPPIAREFPFRGPGIYQVRGKVTEEFGFYSLEVRSMERLDYIEDPRYSLNN